MALGITLAVTFVPVATLTPLPAVLEKLGHRVNKTSIEMKERRAGSSRLTAWGERLWAALDTKTPLALGVILLLGFALLVFALQAPLLALIGRRGLVDTRLAEACPARHPLLTRLAAQPAA